MAHEEPEPLPPSCIIRLLLDTQPQHRTPAPMMEFQAPRFPALRRHLQLDQKHCSVQPTPQKPFQVLPHQTKVIFVLVLNTTLTGPSIGEHCLPPTRKPPSMAARSARPKHTHPIRALEANATRAERSTHSRSPKLY